MVNVENAFWAKMDPLGNRLPLLEHMLDVAGCFRAILEITAYRTSFEALAGRRLEEADLDRLCILAALHDIGKLNHRFQRGDGGHLEEGILWCITTFLDDMLSMGAEETMMQAVCATFSHHGKIVWKDDAHLHEVLKGMKANPSFHETATAEALRIMSHLKTAFPGWADTTKPLPGEPRFWHMFSGLLTIADQIGSGTARFPVLREKIFKRNCRAAVRGAGLCSDLFRSVSIMSDASVFGWPEGAEPTAAQAALRDLPLSDRLILLESETGSGKTEGALMRFRRLANEGAVSSLYFGIPTRSSAVQIQRRVDDAVSRLWGAEAALAVPGYLVYGAETGVMQGPFDVVWGADGKREASRWAVEAPRKYLAARVAVGTVDQALFSGICSKWSNMRSAAMAGALLVIDEVHASDTYMSEVMIGMIQDHLASGGHVLLMSATLSTQRRSEIFEACGATSSVPTPAPYPALTSLRKDQMIVQGVAATGREKCIKVELAEAMTRPNLIAEMAIEAARKKGRVLVIRNSIAGVNEVLAEIKKINAEAPIMTLNGIQAGHHSRYAAEDRKAIDRAVEGALGKKSSDPVIIVGTQTLEQSLDIDADILITDICPIDVLLQRAGRLHRHSRIRPKEFSTPRCVVLHDPHADEKTLKSHQIGHDRAYPDLPAIREVAVMIEDLPVWSIPAMNRALVDRGAAEHLLTTGQFTTGEAADHRGLEIAQKSASRVAMMQRGTMIHACKQETGFGTRLGEMPVTVTLEPPILSAFGNTLIEKIDVPLWMLSKKSNPNEISVKNIVGHTTEENAFTVSINIGGIRLLYGPEGLTFDSEKK
ncbi:MAG: CRISPR-associated helicase Cas3' [Roseibium sp.]|uniref:CRISPR-associated helicase Cas3' n=1 Tax=Roseibium sp. TaxID=1936156 RepID=UPI0032986E12